MRTADPDTGLLPRRAGRQDWRPGQRLATGPPRGHDRRPAGDRSAAHGPGWALDRALARDQRGTYRSGPIRVGVRGGITVHRLGLMALIDGLDVASAHDATEESGPEADVLVLAEPTDGAPLDRAAARPDPRSRPDPRAQPDTRDGREEHPVPVIVATAEAVSARDVLRCLTGPVRGVVTLAAPPTTWACAIAGVVAGGYAVDPGLTRELVLLAAVGTPYGPRPLGLTAQQQRILDLVATGLSNRAIADELGISPDTVKTHLAAAMRQLDARDRTEAAQRLAAARGRMG